MEEQELAAAIQTAETALQAGKPREAAAIYEQLLGQSKSDATIQAKAATLYRDLARAYATYGDNAAAYKAATQAHHLYSASMDKRGLVSINNTLGIICDSRGEYAEAACHYLEALQMLQELNFTPGTAQVLSNLGLTLAYIGAYEEALNYLQESLELWRTQPEGPGLGMACVNLAFVLYENGSLDEAIRYLQEAKDIYERANAVDHEVTVFTNLTNIAQKQNDWAAADRYSAMALEKAAICGSDFRKAIGLNCRGNYLLRTGDREAAFSLLMQALELFKETKVARGLATSYKDLSRCVEDDSEAASYLKKALDAAEQSNIAPVQIEILELMHERHVSRDEWREAHDTAQKLSSLRERMVDDRAKVKVRSLNLEMQLADAKRETAAERKHAEVLRQALDEADRQRQLAQDENRQKTQLLHFAAHDMRNMISGVVGASEYVLEELRSLNATADLKEMASLTAQSARQMLQSLNCILDAAAIENGNVTLHLTEFSARRLLDEAKAFWHYAAQAKRQHLITECAQTTLRVQADRIRILDCMGNLLSNAIKYAPAGSKIVLGAELKDNYVCLYVSDEGPGLSADDLVKLGKPFQKLSALPTAGESSIGIGLFIVKKVLELHCGELKALNRPEGGARFELLWPATSTC